MGPRKTTNGPPTTVMILNPSSTNTQSPPSQLSTIHPSRPSQLNTIPPIHQSRPSLLNTIHLVPLSRPSQLSTAATITLPGQASPTSHQFSSQPPVALGISNRTMLPHMVVIVLGIMASAT